MPSQMLKLHVFYFIYKQQVIRKFKLTTIKNRLNLFKIFNRLQIIY
jgi:hypothetical protein